MLAISEEGGRLVLTHGAGVTMVKLGAEGTVDLPLENVRRSCSFRDEAWISTDEGDGLRLHRLSERGLVRDAMPPLPSDAQLVELHSGAPGALVVGSAALELIDDCGEFVLTPLEGNV